MTSAEEFVAAFYEMAQRATQNLKPGWTLYCYLITPDGDRSSVVSIAAQGEEKLFCTGETLDSRPCEVVVSVDQAILRLEAAPLDEAGALPEEGSGASPRRIGFRIQRG
jgi:hypothetical protein